MGLKVIPNKPSKNKKTQQKSKINKVPLAPGIMRDMDYRAEDDARTLMHAEEIKRDAARLRKAQAVAKRKADEAYKVARL